MSLGPSFHQCVFTALSGQDMGVTEEYAVNCKALQGWHSCCSLHWSSPLAYEMGTTHCTGEKVKTAGVQELNVQLLHCRLVSVVL